MATFHWMCFAFFALGVSLSSCSNDRVLASRYDSLDANSTLLDLLLEPSGGGDRALRSEVFDMLHSSAAELRAKPGPAPAFPEDRPVAAAELAQPEMQAELLQGAEAVVARDRDPARMSSPRAGSRLDLRAALPGIMVGLTCAIVLVAYLALVLHKRHEMTRNGTRHELLRTDEPTTETTVDV